jgi:hypothetical protein
MSRRAVLCCAVLCCVTAAAGRKWHVADPNFIGYTYKNWEAVHSGGEVSLSEAEGGGEGRSRSCCYPL